MQEYTTDGAAWWNGLVADVEGLGLTWAEAEALAEEQAARVRRLELPDECELMTTALGDQRYIVVDPKLTPDRQATLLGAAAVALSVGRFGFSGGPDGNGGH